MNEALILTAIAQKKAELEKLNRMLHLAKDAHAKLHEARKIGDDLKVMQKWNEFTKPKWFLKIRFSYEARFYNTEHFSRKLKTIKFDWFKEIDNIYSLISVHRYSILPVD